MKPIPIFPCILFALDLCAAVECLFRRERYACVYWLAAAALTWCVVQMARGAQ